MQYKPIQRSLRHKTYYTQCKIYIYTKVINIFPGLFIPYKVSAIDFYQFIFTVQNVRGIQLKQ